MKISLSDVTHAFQDHKGQATLQQVYDHISAAKRGRVTDEYQSVIRSIIYKHSSDSRAWIEKNGNVFQSVGPNRGGVWKLRLFVEWFYCRESRRSSVKIP